jgi:hypothetical protein
MGLIQAGHVALRATSARSGRRNRLHAIMQTQLGKQMTDVGLHAAFGEVGLLTDSRFDTPYAISMSTASSPLVMLEGAAELRAVAGGIYRRR